MDAETFFADVKLDSDTSKVLTERFSQVSKSLESLQSEAKANEERFTGSIADRDKAKARVKELEDKIRKGDFDGAKELKELNEKLSKDFETADLSLNEYKGKYEQLEKDFKAKSKELDTLIKEQKEVIIGKLPANLKPSDDLLSKMSVKDLNAFYDGLVKENVVTDKTFHPKNNGETKKADIAKYYKDRLLRQ